jgi:hypothetical protein
MTNAILFYSGAFRGYYNRLRAAKRGRVRSAIDATQLIVTASGRVK